MSHGGHEVYESDQMFSTIYKAVSYYYLMEFTSFEFGELFSLFRDDGTGTVQQHKPSKI